MQYITARGNWYHASWKGDIEKNSGIATNIGVHFLDMPLWIFGDVKQNNVTLHNYAKAAGELELEKANINWMLNIDGINLPEEIKKTGRRTFRSLKIDNEEVDFADGFDGVYLKTILKQQ